MRILVKYWGVAEQRDTRWKASVLCPVRVFLIVNTLRERELGGAGNGDPQLLLLLLQHIVIHMLISSDRGWFVSTGDLASSVFISAIAVHTFFGVVRNYRLPTWAFYCAIALCWLFVYVMAAIGPLLHGKDFYVRAAAWVCLSSMYVSIR
jgi:hypothetical protein